MRNGKAYQRKTEKFSVSEENKFGKIVSSCEVVGRHRTEHLVNPSHYVWAIQMIRHTREGDKVSRDL